VFLLSLSGAVSLAWLAAAALGVVHASPSTPVPILRVVAPVGILILFMLLAGTARRFAMPLGDLMEAAHRVANGDYSTRVREWGSPAMRSLASAFNAMTGRLQKNDEQRRHLMADIAHELRTPLTVMQGRLEGLLDGVYPRDEEHLTRVLDETRVLSRLIEDLRTLALSESGALKLQKEPTDLGMLTREAVQAVEAQAAAQRITLRMDVPADLPLMDVDPVRIREVMTNLLFNALRHTPAGGTIALRAERKAGGAIAVSVADTGAGIAAEALGQVFDRFYKGSDSRGSGLGLTIARKLVVAHGGEISAASELGRGTTITFVLP
jgi:signal transduction histidine kinase